MRPILLIIIVLASINCKSQELQSYEELNVLFIGNSLTYSYNMPQILQLMLNETHPNIKIDQSTFPGFSFSNHLTDIITYKTENGIKTRLKEKGEKTETEIKIAEKKWDVIILQTGTIRVLIPEIRDLKVNKAISDIKKLVTNRKCKFILFNTWPTINNYPVQYCYPARLIDKSLEKDKCCSPSMENLEQELKLINEAYVLLAQKNRLKRSDNGTKFYEVLTKYPEITLYDDDIHPNKYGAFLNACVFYQMITKNKASELEFNGDIEPKTAFLLKQISD
jgi:hypothetical protein